MSDVAIRAEGLSKQYRIGVGRAAHQTFREALVAGAKRPLRRLRGEHREPNTIWALDDVSFEVKHGEAVGIIGRNGAGKSTLLKILSRITRPTRGRVDLYGRVGSLLEVGTGFHSELSGRENIYLNGAILGMTRREIERKFDEIVDFAEIEKFLDTPVKHYSSGMYVRLAFAVAAHLEPEILVVDEVLAVGDAEFQKKSLGKMGDVARGGRTVLFVSHNMSAISSLCSKGILLNDGALLSHSSVREVVDQYMNHVANLAVSTPVAERKDRSGNGGAHIVDVRLRNRHGEVLRQVPLDGGSLSFEVDFEGKSVFRSVWLAIGVYDSRNRCIVWLDSRALDQTIALRQGLNHVACTLDSGFALAKDSYNVNVAILHSSDMLDYLPFATRFDVIEGDFFGTGKSSGGEPAIYVKQDWKSW